MTAITDLAEEIKQSMDFIKKADNIAITLSEAVRFRQADGSLTVSSADVSFSLIRKLGMLDLKRGRATANWPSRYYLNQKAVDYHAALAQEGFYGGKD